MSWAKFFVHFLHHYYPSCRERTRYASAPMVIIQLCRGEFPASVDQAEICRGFSCFGISWRAMIRGSQDVPVLCARNKHSAPPLQIAPSQQLDIWVWDGIGYQSSADEYSNILNWSWLWDEPYWSVPAITAAITVLKHQRIDWYNGCYPMLSQP